MVKQITLDVDTVPTSAIHKSIGWAQSPDVDLAKLYPYDPNKANQMLDQAGFGAWSRTALARDRSTSWSRSVAPTSTRFRSSCSNSGKRLAFPVNLMPLDRQVMQDTVYVKRDFDVNLNELNSAGDPEIGIARAVHVRLHRPDAAHQRRRVLRPERRYAICGRSCAKRSAAARPVVRAGRQTACGGFADDAADRPTGPLRREHASSSCRARSGTRA